MSAPTIDRFKFGSIVIDGESHHRDVIILPRGVKADWWRAEGHSLTPEDLVDVFASSPEVLIVGTGTFSRMHIPAETRRRLVTAGCELLAMATPEACRRYNELKDQKTVAAALHLTC